MYYLNKIVWFFLNPISLVIVMAFVGFILACRRRAGLGLVIVGFSLGLLYLVSTTLFTALVGLPLEKPYLATEKVESLPDADVAVLLGGGISAPDNLAYPDMADGADRVWHAARLYKAGKVRRIVVSGVNDLKSTVPLLVDFGVERSAIEVDDTSRNTYENARFTAKLLEEMKIAGTDSKPRILLVTSAWHMTRALGNFKAAGLEVTPAACDFKATAMVPKINGFVFAPSAEALMCNCVFVKEWIGRLARR